MKTLRFENLQESHVASILTIEQMTNSAPWSEKSFLNELQHKHGIFLVAILEGAVIGYGGVWLVVDEAHVTTISISESQRRKGVGRRLMVELLQRAKDAGMLCSTLEVRASNLPAIKLYEDLGYSVSATRKGYYPDNGEDALVMWLHDLVNWEPSRV